MQLKIFTNRIECQRNRFLQISLIELEGISSFCFLSFTEFRFIELIKSINPIQIPKKKNDLQFQEMTNERLVQNF